MITQLQGAERTNSSDSDIGDLDRGKAFGRLASAKTTEQKAGDKNSLVYDPIGFWFDGRFHSVILLAQ